MAVKKSLKWTILAYASEPDKNYRYEGDFVEYCGKRYWVSLMNETVEFVGRVSENKSSDKETGNVNPTDDVSESAGQVQSNEVI